MVAARHWDLFGTAVGRLSRLRLGLGLRFRFRLRLGLGRRRGGLSRLDRRGRRRSLRRLGFLGGGGSRRGRSRSRSLSGGLGLGVGHEDRGLRVSGDGDGDDVVDPFGLEGTLAHRASGGEHGAGDSEAERRLHLELVLR